MRADGDERHALEAGEAADGAEDGPGRDGRAEERGGDADAGEERRREVARLQVDEAGGGGDRGLVGLLAAEGVADEVRHEEQPVREVQQRRGLGALGVQLEDRVEVHELDAGRVVEGALADEVEDGLGVHGGVAAVAVDVGQAEEAAGSVQQAVVHAPRVDADGGDLAVLRGGGAEAGADVLQQLREVPEEVSGELDGRVVEAGDDLHRELRAVMARGDDAAAAGAEVDRKVGFHSDFLP